MRTLWTSTEVAFLRANYGRRPVEDIACKLGREVRKVYAAAARLGLTKRVEPISRADRATIRRLAKAGICNRCIGRELGRARCTIRRQRRKLGFPDLEGKATQPTCERCIAKVRANTKKQCRDAGVKSLADIRALAYREFARENGWPEQLRPREVQILNALAARGVPMTRLEIAEAIGMRTDRMGANGTLALLVGNGDGGTHTATLLRLGLLGVLKRASPGAPGKGFYFRSRDLYILGPAALAILEARACKETAKAR